MCPDLPTQLARKLLPALCTASLVLLTALCPSCGEAGRETGPSRNGREQFIRNGDLTQGADGVPDHWLGRAWDQESAVFRWNHEPGEPPSLEISNVKPNDSHWAQTVHLEPGWYHVTASLRAEDVPSSNAGAQLGLLGYRIVSETLHGTTDWQTVGFYLEVGEWNPDVVLACRLGGHSSLNTGKVFCRDIDAVPVEEPLDDSTPRYRLDLFRNPATAAAATADRPMTLRTVLATPSGAVALLALLGAALLVVRGRAGAARRRRGRVASEIAPSAARLAKAVRGFFVFALLSALLNAALLPWLNRSHDLLVLCAVVIALVGLAVAPSEDRGSESRLPIPGLRLSLEAWAVLAVFAAFLAFYAATGFAESGYDEPVRQAVAFLQGHTYIDVPEKSYIEYAEVGPYRYALHPPMAPILLMPLALFWGMDTPQTAFTIFVGAVDVALVWALLGRFRLDVNAKVWWTLFFGLGTCFWYETIKGTTWALPMIVAVMFTLAALIEAFGRARPFWLGWFAALATLTRYDLALCAPSIAALALLRGRKIREVLWMAPGFLAVGVFFVLFNLARYDSWFDLGIPIQGPQDQPTFSLRYLPANLFTIFFIAPGFDGRFPFVHPNGMGQAISLSSPALALALRASFRRPETWLMWAAAFLGSLASLLCYATGYEQFGTRHYIQVFPYLLVLVALGAHRADQLAKILIGTSIALIAFGVWHIQTWGFG